MADFPSITTRGGIKAPALSVLMPAAASVSDVVIGFMAFSDLIAEAAAAEERRRSPWACDPACASIVAEDEEALEAARLAAGALVRMPRAVDTDRPLLVASRFLLQGLSLEDAAQRARFRRALRGAHPIYLAGRAPHQTDEAARMIDLAMSRLWWLFAELDAGVAEQFAGIALELSGDADQEVQAFE